MITLKLEVIIPKPHETPAQTACKIAEDAGMFIRGDDYDKEDNVNFYRYIFYREIN